MTEAKVTGTQLQKASTDFISVMSATPAPSRAKIEEIIAYFMEVYTLVTESEHGVYRTIDAQFTTLFREAFIPLLHERFPAIAQDMIIHAYNLAPADSRLEKTLAEYMPVIERPAPPPRPPQP